MPNLTQAQMSQLQQYSTAGDRYNYWNSLAQWGDPYAKLALGVVTNETYSGAIANAHLASVAAANGITMTSDLSWKIGTALMEAA